MWEDTFFTFKTYHRAILTKTIWEKKCRSIELNWSPKNKPLHLWSIVCDKSTKTTPEGQDSLLNKWCRTTRYPHGREWNWTPSLRHTQILT